MRAELLFPACEGRAEGRHPSRRVLQNAAARSARDEVRHLFGIDLVLRLRDARRLHGLTQKEVARRSGVGERTISSFETGDRIDSMKVIHLLRLLKVYGIAPAAFFRWSLETEYE